MPEHRLTGWMNVFKEGVQLNAPTFAVGQKQASGMPRPYEYAAKLCELRHFATPHAQSAYTCKTAQEGSMDYSVYEKDKRIPPRLYPWWLILVGFVFGVIATLIFTAGRMQPSVVYRYDTDPSTWMQAPPAPGEMGNQVIIAPDAQMDRFQATATAIIREATAQAAAVHANSTADPIMLTATYFIAQATEAAQQGR
jgi:hypothetical protein